MHRVVILDTSMLCVWLRVPGKDTCGSGQSTWTYDNVNLLIQEEIRSGSYLVLPLAALIETGNHISHAPHSRFERAQHLAELIRQSAAGTSPWAAFTNEVSLWDADGLQHLANEWPHLANSRLSMGDATIKRVADYYSKIGASVELLTSDQGLRAYQPPAPPTQPRRRRTAGN